MPADVPRRDSPVPSAEPAGITESQALEMHAHGQALQAEARHADALAEFETSARYFASSDGPQSPDLANVLADSAESLMALCRYAEAEAKARRAKEILASLKDLLEPATRGLLVPRGYGVWAHTLRELGRYEEAAHAALQAIREAEECLGKDHTGVSGFLNEYGIICKYWGRFEEGERYYLRALRILEDTFGKESPETATLYHNLGGLEHTRGNFAKGEPLARAAYEIRRSHLGEDHSATLADAVAWCGLLDGLERYEESEPIYRRALAIYEQRFGPDHFEVAATLNNLGMARAAQGDLKEARTMIGRCLAIKRKLFSEGHPEVQLTKANLASLGG